MSSNLTSPNGIRERCDLRKLDSWFSREVVQTSNRAERAILKSVASNLNAFVQWPDHALLLWPECDRGQKYHTYPPHVRQAARAQKYVLDGRTNGPAVATFIIAGGNRPERFGSKNAWSIHHLYSGKFPYLDCTTTIHATKDCKHFTQSAGLVAIHPIADALVDEYPFFTWLLRAHAFVRFGYDPDGVFSSGQNTYGFARGHKCRILKGRAA